jgi:hypothetical protein
VYRLSVGDPIAWLEAAGGLFAIAPFADVVPACRGIRIDPSDALRNS